MSAPASPELKTHSSNGWAAEPSGRLVVSKSQFALLKNVSPGRVSQWISEGKIDRAALIGEGRSAKIDVRCADASLRRRLNIDQRFGNGIGTRLYTLPPAAEDHTAVSPDDPIEEQIKREKLEGLQRENRRRAEEEAARAGRYVDAQNMRADMAGMANLILTIVEGSFPEMATALAAKFNVPQRDMLYGLRLEFREVRIRSAARLKEQAIDMPKTIKVEIEEIGEIEATEAIEDGTT